MPDREAVEVFLQEASEHLQYLREYIGVLQEIAPRREDLERLYISAHTLSGTSASYGFPRFSEISGKLAHVFQYATNASLGEDLHGPLTEFLSDGISLLEADLLEISDTGQEVLDDIAAFKERYRFAFPSEPTPLNYQPGQQTLEEPMDDSSDVAAVTGSYFDALPEDDEVPAEILEFFQPEAEEHLQIVSDCLLSLEANHSPEEINKLFRAIHTVKGSAAQVGLKRLGGIAHRVEDLIGRLREGEIDPLPQVIDLCLESVDVLKKTLHKQWGNEAEMRTGVDSLLNRIAEVAPMDAEDAPVAAEAATANDSAESETAASAQSATPKTGKAANAAAAAKSVRISLSRLDRMMNTVGELVINRTRMLGRVTELERLRDTLGFSKERLQGKVAEFQEQYEFNRINSTRGPLSQSTTPTPQMLTNAAAGDTSFWSEFSELEMDRYDDVNILSRSMTEISADVNEVLSQMGGFIGRVEGDIDEFTKLAHHLQDEITAARMVPIVTLYSRLSRAVRDAAKSTGKQVELDFSGSETELDNNIIQQISDPLVHLVRNSVAHGIELPEGRRTADKSEVGRVTVRAYHRGNHIYIEVEDDGRGIDYDRVRESAVDRGLVSHETASSLTERELREMLFHPGFSTAPLKTELAGRGVGLDVVRANLNSLNRVKLCPGTTIAPDGSLILLLDLNRMIATEPGERKSIQASARAARIFAPGSAAIAKGSIPTDAIDRVHHERVVVVADDSISVRKFVGRMLEKNGYRVILASDGLEAAELITQHGCHLVITDLEMPRMTGYELMAQLRQSPSTRRIPVMVVTSRAGAKHRDRAMKEGAVAFLTKPVQEDQLTEAVEQLIGTEAPQPVA